MPYAVRNSIILGVLLILFTGAGSGYIFIHQSDTLEEIKKERGIIQSQLGDVNDLYNRLAEVQEQVHLLDAAWVNRPKILPTKEIASKTNIYLNEILTKSDLLDLNVLTQEHVEQIGCGYIRYHLAGDGSFNSLARLLQYVEHGPRLMKIRDLDVREVHAVDDERGVIEHKIQFDAELLAYYSNQKPFADSASVIRLEETTFEHISYNPFRSLINPEIPPNVYDLPEVEKSSLLAVMTERAFISDQHNELIMLTEGDEVYLGYVSKIMPERRQVLFLLNKGGLVERYILTLRFQTKLEDFNKNRKKK